MTSCALTAASGVQCWGEGGLGQLGNGSTQDSVTPVDVTGLTSGVLAVTTGEFGSCALTDAGAVKCWGNNDKGQVGGSLAASSSVPVDVVGLGSGVAQVEAYGNHACALTDLGDVQCWGDGIKGELGNAQLNTFSNTPVAATVAPSPTVRLGTGTRSACAVSDTATVVCWGGNTFGLQKDLSVLNQSVDVTAGDGHACSLTTTGKVRCWGDNLYGQLGSGSGINLNQNPVSDVAGLTTGVIAISAGDDHTCAINDQGAVSCWGRNQDGQLGTSSVTISSVPVDAVDATKATRAISSGPTHTCALISGGTIRCWGAPGEGQTGFGWSDVPAAPEAVTAGTGPIAAGAEHTCAATPGDSVTCWGNGDDGRLGFGAGPPPNVPVQVAGLSGVTALTAGDRHTCALTTAGGVRCWGANNWGQVGNGWTNTAYTPTTPVGLSSGVIAIAAGGNHTCAVTTEGAVKCWGTNGSGQLGNASTTAALAPVGVTGLDAGATAIGAGDAHTCAAVAGAAKCWGAGDLGQLGNFGTASSMIPVDVFGLTTGVTSLSGGFRHTCAVVDGGATCWGVGGPSAFGELGNDPSTGSTIPVDVDGLAAGVSALSVGHSHGCAVVNGVTACWGINDHFQIGDGTNTTALQPIAPVGLGTDSLDVAAGTDHTCAIATTGAINCWGSNADRQLGAASATTVISGGPVFYNDTVSPA